MRNRYPSSLSEEQVLRYIDIPPAPPSLDSWDRARHSAFRSICARDGYEWISDDLDVQERYLDMRISGQSHNMAEILASRKFPGTRTDVEWNRGHCNGNQFDSDSEPSRLMGDYYKRVAESRGVSVTGKVYKSGLADYPGDPRAWVSSRGEAQALLEERGWSSEGLVNVKAHPDDTPDNPVVDPALIEGEVDDRVEMGQMLGCADREELADKLTSLRSWKPDHEIGKDTE